MGRCGCASRGGPSDSRSRSTHTCATGLGARAAGDAGPSMTRAPRGGSSSCRSGASASSFCIGCAGSPVRPAAGVRIERVPWAEGKHQLTTTYAWFLARWATRLSWREVAATFRTTWDSVFRAVAMAVAWGRAHQDLTGIEAVGIDEIQWQQWAPVPHPGLSDRPRGHAAPVDRPGAARQDASSGSSAGSARSGRRRYGSSAATCGNRT